MVLPKTPATFLIKKAIKLIMKEIDFKKYCVSCKAWCCKGETNVLGKSGALKSKPSGECEFLEKNLCTNYSKRPFDCRDFPLDVMVIKGKITWVLWENCPAIKQINMDEYLLHSEKKLVKKYGKETITAQAKSNKTDLPKKYDKKRMRILREVKFD